MNKPVASAIIRPSAIDVGRAPRLIAMITATHKLVASATGGCAANPAAKKGQHNGLEKAKLAKSHT